MYFIFKHAPYLDAVVLVQKFGSKFDTQWVNTVKYYSGLFKGMFEENLIVVLTHFDFSERGKFERRLKNQNVPEIRKNVLIFLFYISFQKKHEEKRNSFV